MKKRSIKFSALKLNKNNIASLQYTVFGGEDKHQESGPRYDTKNDCRSINTIFTTSCIACPAPGSATD